jgi:hypothetical protein
MLVWKLGHKTGRDSAEIPYTVQHLYAGARQAAGVKALSQAEEVQAERAAFKGCRWN